MPLTWWLQVAAGLLVGAKAAAALAVRRVDADAAPPFRATWHATGALYAAMTASALAQNAWGAWALAAGPGSAAWRAYLGVMPAFNHSRAGAELAFCALLVAAARRRRRRCPLRAWTVWGAVAAGLAAGAAAGWGEYALGAGAHFWRAGLGDAALMLLWTAALAAAMLAEVVDRWLVGALALHAVQLPLNALWLVWLARAGAGGWAPSPAVMQGYRIALGLAILALVLHRLRLARRGEPVADLSTPAALIPPRRAG